MFNLNVWIDTLSDTVLINDLRFTFTYDIDMVLFTTRNILLKCINDSLTNTLSVTSLVNTLNLNITSEYCMDSLIILIIVLRFSLKVWIDTDSLISLNIEFLDT